MSPDVGIPAKEITAGARVDGAIDKALNAGRQDNLRGGGAQRGMNSIDRWNRVFSCIGGQGRFRHRPGMDTYKGQDPDGGGDTQGGKDCYTTKATPVRAGGGRTLTIGFRIFGWFKGFHKACSVSGVEWLTLAFCEQRLFPSRIASMHERKYRRHKDKRRNGGKHEAADYGAAERRILFPTIPQAESHRNHADNHGQSSHADRAETSQPRLDRGQDSILMLCVTDLGKRDDENTVCRGHPHAHDGSHQGGHAEPGVGIEEKQDDTSERGRQRGDDNEGVSPRLKVDDDQHVYENDRKDQTAKKRDVGAAHGVYLPQNRDRGAPGEVAFESIYNPLNIPSHSSQVAILHRAVDIDDAAHVVLGNVGH